MDWRDMINEIADCVQRYPKCQWPNLVVVLSKGVVRFGSDNLASISNSSIEGIKDLRMFGEPDHTNFCLLGFYGMLMSLLRDARLFPIEISKYVHLPLIGGDLSYQFLTGYLGESATCEKHGNYPKRISEANLRKIVDVAMSTPRLDIRLLFDPSKELSGDHVSQVQTPNDGFRTYNPQRVLLKDLFPVTNGGFGAEIIVVEGEQIWISVALRINPWKSFQFKRWGFGPGSRLFRGS